MDQHPHGEHGLTRFSFWKPDPVPPKNSTILPVTLDSLGSLNRVTEMLFDVPHMTQVPKAPWEMTVKSSCVRLQWQVEEGVILKVRAETGPPKPGEVLTLEAHSATPAKTFYRLYVQIYEQFGATLLDERVHGFLTPREFRAQMAS